MKKVRILLVCALAVTSFLAAGSKGASADQVMVTGDGGLNVTIAEKDEKAEPKNGSISLYGNPSTGYEWQYAVKDETVAEVINERFVSDVQDLGGEESCGCGGTFTWDVKGLKEGKTEVTFNYLRPWEEEVIETVTYVINVDADLNVTIAEKAEKAEPKNGSISLYGNPSTGCQWQYAVKDETVAEVINERFVSDVQDVGEEDLCGCGGTFTWDVKGLKEGSTEVTFNYSQPWETEIYETAVYVINVDADLNVTVTKKEDKPVEEIKNISVQLSENTSANQINPTIRIKNESEEELDLSKVKVKYYYTADGDEDESFVCYYAGTTSGTYKQLTSYVNGQVVKLEGDQMVEGSDRCLEITFTGGVLDAKQDSMMQLCVHKDNWTNYDKSNDYSYNNPENVVVTVLK